MYKTVILLALVATSTAGGANELLPLQAESIRLGSIRGVAYYTETPDGFRVVTTLADGQTGLPVRFEATLTDNQSLIISVPGKLGEPGHSIEIARAANKLVVAAPQPVGEAVATVP